MFFLPILYGQEARPNFPNGFHLGITGEGNIAQRMNVIPIGTGYVDPISAPTMGWQAGLEFSYHFANYFGASIGIDYGTMAQFKTWYWTENGLPGYMPQMRIAFCRFQMPIKFEFHHPILKSNFSLYSAIGVNLVDVAESLLYDISGESYGTYCWFINFGGHNPTDEFQYQLYDANGHKLKVELQLNLGIYYRLPYNDLLRLSVLANVAFKDRFQGWYEYLLQDDAYGALSYRHNHIGLELAYIHSFKTRAQRKEKQNKFGTQTFDFSRPVHSVTLNFNSALAVGGHVNDKSGTVRTVIPLSFTPELSLKYNCTFAKGFGLSAELPLGFFDRSFYVDLEGSLPSDTIWSNGAVGQENLYDNKLIAKNTHYGFSLKTSYLAQIHNNMFIQPELGISFKPLMYPKKDTNPFTELTSVIYPNEEDGQAIPFTHFAVNYHTKNYWIPNLSGAVNFLVHGKNPCHNFVFGLNFNVDFSKRMTIDYQTVPSFPDKYKSSGQMIFNMTTVGLHVGYQFMTGRKQAIGNR